jgi:release factor glutamine methyltransferase
VTLVLPLSVRALRHEIAQQLAAAGVRDAPNEARDLIAAVLNQPRFWAVAHAEDPIDADAAAVRAAAERRAAGMPFAYAVGKAAFRHLTLQVDRRVLIPRQETELLVDLVLQATRGRGIVADVATGSGCIACALASEGNYTRVIATDISPDALAVARENVGSLAQPHAIIELRRGDLLAPLTSGDGIAAVVVNPPYIAPGEMDELPESVRLWEPHLALESSRGGLAHTFAVVDDAPRVLAPGGILALEVDSRRARRVAEYVAECGRFQDIVVHRDLTGRERFVFATAADPQTSDLRPSDLRPRVND